MAGAVGKYKGQCGVFNPGDMVTFRASKYTRLLARPQDAWRSYDVADFIVKDTGPVLALLADRAIIQTYAMWIDVYKVLLPSGTLGWVDSRDQKLIVPCELTAVNTDPWKILPRDEWPQIVNV